MDVHARHPPVANHSHRDLAADHPQGDPTDDHDQPPGDLLDADGHRHNDHVDDLHRADQSGAHDHLLDDPRGADDLRQDDPSGVLNGSQGDDRQLPGDRLVGLRDGDDCPLDGSGARPLSRPEGRDVVAHRAGYRERNHPDERGFPVEQGDLQRRHELSADLPVLVGQRAWP